MGELSTLDPRVMSSSHTLGVETTKKIKNKRTFALACVSQNAVKAEFSFNFQVKVGDTLDLLIGEDKEAETETVMRVLLKKVLGEKTESEKYRVVLRRWKKLKLPKNSMSK